MPALARYENRSLVEPVGVVRLQDDATAAARGIIQGTAELSAAAQRITRDAEVRYVNEFALKQRERQAEYATKHQLDPDGFKASWEGYSQGALSEVPSVFRAAATQTLSELGSSAYATIVNRRAANERQNAEQSWNANNQAEENEYIAHLRAGRVREADAVRVRLEARLEQGVRDGYIDAEGETFRRQRLGATGQAVLLERTAEAAYAKGGRPAAEAVLKRLDTDPLFATVRREAVSAETVRTNVNRMIAERERQAAAARAAVAGDVRNQLDRLGDGELPDWSVIEKATRVVGEGTPQGKEIRKFLALAPALEGFSRLSPSLMEANIAETAGRYADPKASPEDRLELQFKQRIYARTVSALKEDSFTYAQRRFATPDTRAGDIDLTRPGGNVAEFKRRAAFVDSVAPSLDGEPLPFSRQEFARVANIFNNGGAPDQLRLMAELSEGFGPQRSARLLARLAGEGAAPATIYAASVAKENPTVAREILEGRNIMGAEKKLKLVNEEDLQRSVNNYVGTAYGPGRAGDEARNAGIEAVRARVAVWAKNNGKLGEEVPSSVIYEIAKSTLGNVVWHKNGKLFPPRRTMTQDDFDRELDTLTDQDAGEFVAMDGSKFRLSKALEAGQLVGVGDGKYAIKLGEGYFLGQPDAPWKPFLLDRDLFDKARTRIQYEDFGSFAGNEVINRARRRPSDSAPLLPSAPPGSRDRKMRVPAYRQFLRPGTTED